MMNLYTAIQDFRQARRQARLEDFFARLAGESTDLLPYEEVRRLLRANQKTERGLQQIPLDAIVGSVGRYRDFSRTFLPKSDSDEARWAQVKVAQYEKGLPPIDVYQLGDVYFVQDGNHRVSVARQQGSETIEAYVTEVHTSVPITPDLQLDELILKAEYADFLHQTELDQLRPNANLSLTSPGNYPLLLEHIDVHKYFMGIEQGQDIEHSQAVGHWYDTVFAPTVQMIREQGLLAGFPERTAADLYVWLAKNRAELEGSLGWRVSTPTAVSALSKSLAAEQSTGLLNRALQTVTGQTPTRRNEWWIEQYLQTAVSQLFATILLPLSPADSDWHAIDQAITWAKQADSQLIGLYAVAETAEQTGIIAQIVGAHFQDKAATAQLNALFKAEVGSLHTLTPRLARWADLVVLSLPAADDAWETVRQVRGLMLLVPPVPPSNLRAALVVYDSSPYGVEALLVAAYLQREWNVALTVLAAEEQATQATAVLADYEITADLVTAPAITAVSVQQAAQQRQLIVLGGYTSAIAFRQRRDFLDELVGKTAVSLLLCR